MHNKKISGQGLVNGRGFNFLPQSLDYQTAKALGQQRKKEIQYARSMVTQKPLKRKSVGDYENALGSLGESDSQKNTDGATPYIPVMTGTLKLIGDLFGKTPKIIGAPTTTTTTSTMPSYTMPLAIVGAGLVALLVLKK